MKNTRLIQFIDEDQPGEKWLAWYQDTIEAYRKWFLTEGELARPDLESCEQALAEYMPELLPVWQGLLELTDAGDLEARLLSLYRPAVNARGCSQAVWSKYNPVLVRNYDFDIELAELRFLKSRWIGTPVIASTDSLWGALDGMNEHGLCASIAFGGSDARGDGFAISLILRYILETCQSTAQAIEVLQRVPSHMAYNVTLLDASFVVSTVELQPGNIPRVTHIPLAVNHQGEYELTDYAIFSRSYERKKFLIDKLYDPGINIENFIDSFEYAPLFSDNYKQGFGTLYTAVYNPTLKACEFRWPYGVRRYKSFASFEEESFWVSY